MKIEVRAVGKMRDRRMSDVCDEYLLRARRHLPIDEIEVEDDAGLIRKTPVGAEIIAMEADGKMLTSQEFAEFVRKRMNAGTRALVFLIGGADGLGPEAVAAASMRLSLSRMTLPHRLARVVLCEQLYRALSIIRGEPYDR